MPAPTNQTAATAVELGPLPNAIAQRVDDAGTTYTVFYQYTAQPGDVVVGIWAFGDLVTYKPTISVFLADGVTPYLSLAAVNVPLEFPVTPGTIYKFQIAPNAGNPTPANLVVSGLKGPTFATPRGSLVVNDDGLQFAAVLSAFDGSVLRFVNPFPSGEGGIGLLTATNRTRMLFHDNIGSTLQLFDNELNKIATIAYTTVSLNAIVSRNQSQTFYVADPGQGLNKTVVKTLSNAGVFGGTTWTLPQAGLTAMAPNAGETVLYNCGQGGSVGAPIKQWDLVNSVMLADLVAGVANYTIPDLLVLGDGSLIPLYFRASTGDVTAKRYTSGGVLQNTYSFGLVNGSTNPRLCHAIDDPTSFWVWIHKPTGFSRFVNVRASDGTLLRDFSSTVYEGGAFQPAATATPTRFGHSFSCPIVIMSLDPLAPCAG